ncbi:MAG TPA: hypothetical protein HPP87_13095 [Planctomycetes bacterium]|nr:hypothetical protein [Planctomycetota bacterium]
MKFTLDGNELFGGDDVQIKVFSFSRASIERTISGVDGVLSIDLGNRGRKVQQSGMLRANSRTQMRAKIDAIGAYMDGCTHTLVTEGGKEYDNLRVDSFETTKEKTSGGGVIVDYKIVYTQLAI